MTKPETPNSAEISVPLIAYGTLHDLKLLNSDFAVFGGTFDPIHEGHVCVIRQLLSHFKLVLVAPTAQNPWKSTTAAPFETRRKMIELVLAAENIPVVEDLNQIPVAPSVIINRFPYHYSIELVQYLRNNTSRYFYWAVSSDLEREVHLWKNWHEAGVKTIVMPFTVRVSATEVRSGKTPPHPALNEFLASAKLYKRAE